MKKLLMVTNGEHIAARIFKTASVLLIGIALGLAFMVASVPMAQAQENPAQMLQAELGGKTMRTASKADSLQAVCSAVKKNRGSAPQIMRVAVAARPEWKNDILRTAFQCLGSGDCKLLNRVLQGAIAGSPGDASEMTQLAIELAPDCAGAFGGAPGDPKGAPGVYDEGVFGLGPGNQNPPPGTIVGGGGQGNVIAICHNNRTIFVSPQGAENHLNNHPGDTLGACVVTEQANN